MLSGGSDNPGGLKNRTHGGHLAWDDNPVPAALIPARPAAPGQQDTHEATETGEASQAPVRTGRRLPVYDVNVASLLLLRQRLHAHVAVSGAVSGAGGVGPGGGAGVGVLVGGTA